MADKERWLVQSDRQGSSHPLKGRLESALEVEKFRALVELSNDFIAIAGMDQSVEYINRAGRELIGLASLEEAQSTTIRDMLTDEGWERSLTIEQPAVVEQGFWRGESTLRHQVTGEEIPVSINSYLLTDPYGGEPLGLATVQHDIRAFREVEEQLRTVANHDHLTGMFNRRYFQQALESRLDHSKPTSGTEAGGGAVILVDLDNFKIVNDSLGHTAGDELLKVVAGRLAEGLPPGALLARLGGDEFAVHVSEMGADDAHALAEGLLSHVRAGASHLHVTASAGVAVYQPGPTIDPGDVLVAADVALYKAKEGGRDRVIRYSGDRGTGLTWVDRIRDALATDGLLLDVQPVYSVNPLAMAGSELLVRMLNERGDRILPASFLPTAERFGLTGMIDEWVIRRGLKLAATGHRVGINLSAHSLGNRALAEEIQLLANELSVEPATVVFEVTETAMIANLDVAGEFVKALRAVGFRFALDDFGTGFGSLSALHALPIDLLKIDQEFVRVVARDNRARMIIQSVVDCARRFNVATVAEGVEDEAALDTVRELGVDFAQGWFLGMPRPIDE